MNLELSNEEVAELHELLGEVLSDLSSEIADTDNVEFQRGLRSRRERLEGIRQKLSGGSE